MNTLKLKPLIEGFQTSAPATTQAPKKEWTTEEKKQALSKIAEYNTFSESLYRKKNLMELAHELSEIATLAKELALHETEKAEATNESWFNKRVVEKNFDSINKTIMEINKIAKEAHGLEQQLQACYEDVGHLLERYYDVKTLEEGQSASCKI